MVVRVSILINTMHVITKGVVLGGLFMVGKGRGIGGRGMNSMSHYGAMDSMC